MPEHLGESDEQIPADADIEALGEVNPFEVMGSIINEALLRATAQIEAVVAEVMPYPTDEEIFQWRVHPEHWPYTPPLEVYRVLEQEDDNLRWRVATGHIMNLLDMAYEKLEALNLFAGPEDAEPEA